MSPTKASVDAIMAYTPQRGTAETDNEQPIPWTEQVARSRARAPIRRLSASDEPRAFQSTAQREQRIFMDGLPDEGHPWRGGNERGFFGLPSPVTQNAGMADAMNSDTGLFSRRSNHSGLSLGPSDANGVDREAQNHCTIKFLPREPMTMLTPVQYHRDEIIRTHLVLSGSGRSYASQMRKSFSKGRWKHQRK